MLTNWVVSSIRYWGWGVRGCSMIGFQDSPLFFEDFMCIISSCKRAVTKDCKKEGY